MSAPTPTAPPDRLVAGDSASWTFRDPDYPSADWTLGYAFEGIDKFRWDPSYAVAQDDGSFTVTLPTEATALLRPDSYFVTRTLTSASQRLSFTEAACLVLPDPAQTKAGDRRSWAKRTLENVETAIDTLFANQALTYVQVGRRIYQRTQLEVMLQARTRLRAEVAASVRTGFGQTLRYRFRGVGL